MTGGLLLPQFVGTAASSWQLVDWLTPDYTATATSAGRAVIECDQLDPDELWLIDHAVVASTSTTDTTLRLYDTYPDRARIRDGSRAGNFDVTEYPQGLVLRPSTRLVAVWDNATPGSTSTLTLQVRQLRRS